MTDALFALVADWGVAVLLVATFASCLALPVPSSMLMLAGGAFVVSGDLPLAPVAGAALVGAIAGDQAGFALGRGAGALATGRLARGAGTARVLAQARAALARRGVAAVFFSRWLFSPLGPYVNLLAGWGGMAWPRFTLAAAAGEAVWVAVYVGAGMLFAAQIAAVAEVLGASVGLLTSVLVAGLAGLALMRTRRPR